MIIDNPNHPWRSFRRRDNIFNNASKNFSFKGIEKVEIIEIIDIIKMCGIGQKQLRVPDVQLLEIFLSYFDQHWRNFHSCNPPEWIFAKFCQHSALARTII